MSCEPTRGLQMRPEPGDMGSEPSHPLSLGIDLSPVSWGGGRLCALQFLLHPEGYPARLGSPWVTPGFGACRELFQGSFGHGIISRLGQGHGLWDGFSAGCSGSGAPGFFPPCVCFPWHAVKLSSYSWEGVVGIKCEGGTAKSCFSPVSAQGSVSLGHFSVATAGFWRWIGICRGGNHWDIHCRCLCHPTVLVTCFPPG